MTKSGATSPVSRREFFPVALVGLSQKSGRTVTGGFVFESHTMGHQMRDRKSFPQPTRRERVPLVIVGGGMAGLSAAWRLGKRGFNDYVLLEMEEQAGGNSRSGENEISRHPWAAHYLPVPNISAKFVRELLEEFGLLVDGKFDERHLCHSPQERLYMHGRWQEGLEPDIAATREDRRQFLEFQSHIEQSRASGQFTIPMELGAKASPLDQLNFKQWLLEKKLTSPYLHWFADYSCRDDYGSSSAETSAWAGIHYFAAREHEEKGPFTWPEGNAWIAKRLIAKAGNHVRRSEPVRGIRRSGTRWLVTSSQAVYDAECVIFAAPTFLAPYLIEGQAPFKGIEYSPWLTANLTLDRMPAERGSPLAWDNVIYGSPSLGYVVATHQSLASRIDKSVWTYYQALCGEPPAAARKKLLASDWGTWKERILTDLEKAHPDIRDCVSRIDLFRIGHAMARPTPGFLTNAARKHYGDANGSMVFANSDLSGFSIFEQAQYRGVIAADKILKRLGRV